ncbi:MAG: YkgJ family cysteine cluster protein [Anaerolineae bacterium]|nr:YkgJ family cysteine cluster protein [Anaerolineae bacterium]
MKECNQCGKCCTNYSNGGLSASASEIESWENSRPDITRYVNDGKIWMDPTTGEQLKLCPWLKKLPNENKYTCDIYYDRPDDCKLYPVTIDDMIKDECEMLEKRDLINPKQAQKTLDQLMADSRPPFEQGD